MAARCSYSHLNAVFFLSLPMAPHSSTLAWKIPWTEEPGGLPVHGVDKSWTWLSDFTFTFHFHALEKEMATHSSVLAWRIPGTGEPSGLPSMWSHRVGHDWSNLAAAAPSSLGRILVWIKSFCCFSSGSYPVCCTNFPERLLACPALSLLQNATRVSFKLIRTFPFLNSVFPTCWNELSITWFVKFA